MSHHEKTKLSPETPVSTAPRPKLLRQRVAGAILEAAAELVATRGDRASMSDVATAAGVGRATLYRYFPSREALLEELAQVALREAGDALAAARLESVSVEEGVERAVRALVAVGAYFIVLAGAPARPEPQRFAQAVALPLRTLLERGQAAGGIRADVPSWWLTEALISLVVGVAGAAAQLGAEDRVAAVVSLFLDGARVDRARNA